MSAKIMGDPKVPPEPDFAAIDAAEAVDEMKAQFLPPSWRRNFEAVADEVGYSIEALLAGRIAWDEIKRLRRDERKQAVVTVVQLWRLSEHDATRAAVRSGPNGIADCNCGHPASFHGRALPKCDGTLRAGTRRRKCPCPGYEPVS